MSYSDLIEIKKCFGTNCLKVLAMVILYNTLLYSFYFLFYFSEMAGRMESHAHAFQQMLKQERQNLDKSLNHQKADMLQRLVMFCGCAFRIQARI